MCPSEKQLARVNLKYKEGGKELMACEHCSVGSLMIKSRAVDRLPLDGHGVVLPSEDRRGLDAGI